MKTKVKFKGFLQTVEREFPTPEAAETWLRKIGKWRQAGWNIEVSPAQPSGSRMAPIKKLTNKKK